MKELRATVLVGLLAIVSVGLVILGVVNVGKGPGDSEHTYVIAAMFDDATGVAKGTKVTIAGYPVGHVVGVKLDGDKVRVALRLINEVRMYSGKRGPDGALVNAATVTRLQASLLGDYYLEVTPGHAGKLLGPQDMIPIVVTTTAVDATLQKLETAATILPKIDQIAADIGKITANAAQVFGGKEGGAKFENLADNLVTTSKNLATTSDLVRRRLETGPLAAGKEFDESIKNLNLFATQAAEIGRQAAVILARAGNGAVRGIEDFEQIAKTVKQVVGSNAKDVDSTVGNLAATLKKLQTTLDRADRVMANLEVMTERTKAGEGTVGRLLTDDKIAKDTERMVAGARELVERFTGGDTGIDFRTMYYAGFSDSDANTPDHEKPNRWRTQLNFRIQPSKEKYYLLGISTDIRRAPGQTVTTMRKDAAGKVVEQEVVVTNMDDIKFNFQYARRFGFVALRGGLLESRAAIGFDLFAFNDKIEFGTDVLRFTEDKITEDVPAVTLRVRSRLLWHFLPFAYVMVGGDELLVPSRRDVFFGLGINFTDNDLILLFASSPAVRFN